MDCVLEKIPSHYVSLILSTLELSTISKGASLSGYSDGFTAVVSIPKQDDSLFLEQNTSSHVAPVHLAVEMSLVGRGMGFARFSNIRYAASLQCPNDPYGD